MQCKYPIQ